MSQAVILPQHAPLPADPHRPSLPAEITKMILSLTDCWALNTCLRVSKFFYGIAGELKYKTLRITMGCSRDQVKSNRMRVLAGLFRKRRNTKDGLWGLVRTLRLESPYEFYMAHHRLEDKVPNLEVLVIETFGGHWKHKPDLVSLHALRPSSVVLSNLDREGYCFCGKTSSMMSNKEMACDLLPLLRHVNDISFCIGWRSPSFVMPIVARLKGTLAVHFVFQGLRQWRGSLFQLCMTSISHIEFVNVAGMLYYRQWVAHEPEFDTFLESSRLSSFSARHEVQLKHKQLVETVTSACEAKGRKPPTITFTTKAEYIHAGRQWQLDPETRRSWVEDVEWEDKYVKAQREKGSGA
ncbi:hypothetical protein P7C73_g1256, partial [Tremellales sp. Uapishka_1]